MRWSEFTNHHAARFSLTKKASHEELGAVFETIRDVVLSGGEVRVPAFGTFKLRTRKARTVRNQSTGELMPLPLLQSVGFSASRFARRAS